jgi:hypothetical protein
MAWASTDIQPGFISLSPIYSTAVTSVVNPITVKLTPQNSSNTAFDFTAATATSLKVANINNVPPPSIVQLSVTPTLVAHDATGLTISVSASNLTAMFAQLGSGTASLTLTATDGTTELVVATGTAQLLVGA